MAVVGTLLVNLAFVGTVDVVVEKFDRIADVEALHLVGRPPPFIHGIVGLPQLLLLKRQVGGYGYPLQRLGMRGDIRSLHGY